MHAITMLFLCELLFNIGTFLECMLDNTLSYAAIGTIIAMTNTIIVIVYNIYINLDSNITISPNIYISITFGNK